MQPERTTRPLARTARGSAVAPWLCALALLGGCTTLGGGAAGEALARGGSADRAVAAELVGVLARAYPPLETTVQVNRAADDPALERLVGALLDRGFGIQRVSADQGAHYLAFSRDVTAAVDGRVSLITWRLAVGELEARRAYTVRRDGSLATAGPLALVGTSMAIGVEALADSSIALGVASHDRVIRVEAENAAPSAAAPAPPGSWTAVEPVPAEPVPAPGPRVDASTADAFPGHRRVARRAVRFADDSVALDDAERRALDAFVVAEGRPGDRVGVLGCGGASNALALGRTRAVANALVTHGLSAAGRYGEPCPEAASVPGVATSEDVVVELWRRAA